VITGEAEKRDQQEKQRTGINRRSGEGESTGEAEKRNQQEKQRRGINRRSREEGSTGEAEKGESTGERGMESTSERENGINKRTGETRQQTWLSPFLLSIRLLPFSC
jgi:hypothetical protein